MNEKEKRILSLMGRALPVMPEFEKGRMLGIAEAMSFMSGQIPMPLEHRIPESSGERPRTAAGT